MKLAKILSVAGAAIAVSAFAGAANAAVYTIDLSLNATPDSSSTLTPPGAGYTDLAQGWSLGGFTPFNVVSGDEVDVNLSFSGPVSLSAGTYSNLQGVNIGLNTAGGTVILEGLTTTTTETLVGASGDVVTNPSAPYTLSANFAVNGGRILGGTNLQNLTDSTLSFTGIDFVIDIDSITAQSAPFSVGSLSLSSDFNSVPAPGAFALLGLGLAGLGATRRRANQAAA